MKLNFFKNNKSDIGRAFSSIDPVYECLHDQPRTLAFESAIKKVVDSNKNVLDLGTGSGVMALFSARSGAKEVVAVEFDPYIASIAKKNIEDNNYNNIISVLEEDARELSIPNKKFDVVVMEMLTTGMVDEYQVQASNNLHKKGLVSKETVFLPHTQDTYLQLLNTDFNVYNFNFKFVRHVWSNQRDNEKLDTLSEKAVLSSISFDTPNIPELFKAKIEFTANKTGVVNSVLLTSRTHLTKTDFIDDTISLNAPVVIPVEEFSVEIGQKVSFNVEYTFGEGYEHFKINRL